LQGHAAGGELGHGALQDSDGCRGGFVVVDFGVSDAGMVVDDRVHERRPDQWIAVNATVLGCRGGAVLAASLPADVAPSAAIGDIAQLFTSTWIYDPGVACS
jgi:hypothetical protein